MDAVRLNVTHMNVTWVTLTPEQARGFITGYTVTYQSLALRSRKEAVMEFVQPGDTYKIIGGLEYTTPYLVTVSARTAVGEGISSPAITVHGMYACCRFYQSYPFG